MGFGNDIKNYRKISNKEKRGTIDDKKSIWTDGTDKIIIKI